MKNKKEKTSKPVYFRLTESEFAALKKAADKELRSPGNLAKKVILDYLIKSLIVLLFFPSLLFASPDSVSVLGPPPPDKPFRVALTAAINNDGFCGVDFQTASTGVAILHIDKGSQYAFAVLVGWGIGSSAGSPLGASFSVRGGIGIHSLGFDKHVFKPEAAVDLKLFIYYATLGGGYCTFRKSYLTLGLNFIIGGQKTKKPPSEHNFNY